MHEPVLFFWSGTPSINLQWAHFSLKWTFVWLNASAHVCTYIHTQYMLLPCSVFFSISYLIRNYDLEIGES